MSSESATLAWAAREAQRILAPMTDPDGHGTFTLTVNGTDTDYTGAMSIFEKVLVPTPNGYEEQRQIKIAATAAQFAALPEAAGRPRFTARGLAWVLISAEPGPQFYVLTGKAI